MADTNFDGKISQNEYVFFMNLLFNDYEKYRIAFKVFDINGDGSISIGKFFFFNS